MNLWLLKHKTQFPLWGPASAQRKRCPMLGWGPLSLVRNSVNYKDSFPCCSGRERVRRKEEAPESSGMRNRGVSVCCGLAPKMEVVNRGCSFTPQLSSWYCVEKLAWRLWVMYNITSIQEDVERKCSIDLIPLPIVSQMTGRGFSFRKKERF